MATATLSHRQTWQHQAWKFARTPKGLLLGILAAVALIAVPKAGVSHAVPEVLAAVAAAGFLDAAIVRLRHAKWEFPSGALLTGLIIALVLRPQEPLTTVLIVSLIAIVTKHLLRTRWSNIFNPAALAIVASSFLFATGQSWWGALPDLGLIGFAVLLGAGLFIADRVNKLPLVVVFLCTYFALFTAASFIGKPVDVAEIFRTPDLQAALFFAFFMLDDPPTCPIHYEDQVPFAMLVAVASFLVFTINGAVYFLPAGLLAGNAWESARRHFHDSARKMRLQAA
jgi:Na+-translocating ferredoxin:NAD+ oxidoreductase RnfD subunit